METTNIPEENNEDARPQSIYNLRRLCLILTQSSHNITKIAKEKSVRKSLMTTRQ